MKRKTFIRILAGGAIVVTLPVAWYYFRDIEYDPHLAVPESLLAILGEEEVLVLGKKYCSEFPYEGSERRLVNLLSKDIMNNGVVDSSKVESKIKQDFKAGSTVQLNGWILSITEARQCALYSIRNSN